MKRENLSLGVLGLALLLLSGCNQFEGTIVLTDHQRIPLKTRDGKEVLFEAGPATLTIGGHSWEEDRNGHLVPMGRLTLKSGKARIRVRIPHLIAGSDLELKSTDTGQPVDIVAHTTKELLGRSERHGNDPCDCHSRTDWHGRTIEYCDGHLAYTLVTDKYLQSIEVGFKEPASGKLLGIFRGAGKTTESDRIDGECITD